MKLDEFRELAKHFESESKNTHLHNKWERESFERAAAAIEILCEVVEIEAQGSSQKMCPALLSNQCGKHNPSIAQCVECIKDFSFAEAERRVAERGKK